MAPPEASQALIVAPPEHAPRKKRGTGRPSICSESLLTNICRLVAEGSNLNVICAQDGMPSRETVYEWLQDKPGFLTTYMRAREIRSDFRSDRIDDYVRKALAGELDANVARVIIQAEQWQAAKETPKVYGDHQSVEHSGTINLGLAGRIEQARKREIEDKSED